MLMKTCSLAEAIERQRDGPGIFPSVELGLDRRYCYFCHVQYGIYAPVNFMAVAQQRFKIVTELATDGTLKEVRYGVCNMHARKFGIGHPDVELEQV